VLARSSAIATALTTAVGAAPVRLFRQVVSLSFDTGGADRVVVDAPSTRLRGSFSTRELNAKPVAAMPRVSSAVLVALDGPREIRRVSVGLSNAGTWTAQLFRLDADRLVATPTVTATQGTTFGGAPFVDQRFAVRFVASTGAVQTVSDADVTEVLVRSRPNGPRLAVSRAGAEGAAVTVWQQLGEVGSAAFSADAAFAAELQRLLDGLPRPLPDPLSLSLVVESAAPCTLAVSHFQVGYTLERTRYVESDENVVLRFDSPAERQATLALPAGAHVRSAVLESVEAFDADFPLAGEDGPVAVPEQDPPLVQQHGSWLGADVAAPLAVAVPVAAAGVAIGLLALAADSEVRLRVQTAAHGAPSGETLFEGAFGPLAAGVRAWSALRFADVLELFPDRPLWLVLSVGRGRVVWLADASLAHAIRVLPRELPVPEDAPEPVTDTRPALRVGATPIALAEPGGLRRIDATAAVAAAVAAGSARVPVVFSSAFRGAVTLRPPLVSYELA
jgi:hypothetical protein